MIENSDGFLSHRTTEAEVDIDQYRALLRWLSFVALRSDHYEVYAQPDLPQATWQERRNDDDILLGLDAFPLHPEKGSAHIQIFGEGHPMYSPLGINAIVGTRDADALLQLWVLGTDGNTAWVNHFRTGEPIGAPGFERLTSDFQEIII